MKRLLTALLCTAMLVCFAGLANAKTIKVALDADPVSLDPHVQLSGGMLQYSHIVFDPLVRWAPDGSIEPRLATEWKQIDDLTTRFTLRKGVKFHSGNDFTAKDVKWTLERLKKSQDFKFLFELFAGAKVVDDYTVDIMTTQPYGLVLAMSTYIFPMDSEFYTGDDPVTGKPKDAIVKTDPSFALTNESGTGPYKVTYREQGVKTVFERVDYWDANSPGNVDEIVLTPIKEEATRVAAILSGDVDFISPVPPQDLNRVGNTAGLQLVTMSGTRVITVQLNQKRRPEFANAKVRQAIAYATNNEGIVKKIMKGFATAAGQQSPEGYAGYNKNLVPRYDLEKAKQLMKEAGYPNGFSCTMIAPNNRYVNDEKIAQAFASMLAKIGIKVELKTMPKAQYWDEFDAQVADIQMIGWHSDTEDTANFFEYLLACPNKETGAGQYNSGNYCNPQVDKLIEAANKEFDEAKRSFILQRAEALVYEDAGFIPFHWQNNSWCGTDDMENLPTILNVMNFPYFGDLKVK